MLFRSFIVPLGHAGLALAISLGAWLNAGILWHRLRKAGIYRPQPGWALFVLKVAAAVAVMSIALWLAADASPWWLQARGRTRILMLGGLVALGMALYFGMLWCLGFRLREFRRNTA